MAFRSGDGMSGELQTLRRQVSELAERVARMATRRSAETHYTARNAGQQLVRAGGQAGAVARRHPAATGFALLAVFSTLACLAILANENARNR